MPLVAVKRWQPWTRGRGVACSKVRSTSTPSQKHRRLHGWSFWCAVLRTPVCFTPSAVMTIWWDLMSVHCELYRNWQGHPCILKSLLFRTTLQACLSPSAPYLTLLRLSFSISPLNKQRWDCADKFSKNRLKDRVRGRRSERERDSVPKKLCVWKPVSTFVSASKSVFVCLFMHAWICTRALHPQHPRTSFF